MAEIIDIQGDNVEIQVDRHSNMLLIGKAATSYAYKEINYEEDYDSVLANYGDSDLTTAFKIAQDAQTDAIFLLNIQDNYDIISVIEDIKQNDFAYIVPVNMYLSDFFYDAYNDNRKTYYIEYMLREMKDYNESMIIATDKHASLYEDQDAFLDEYNKISELFELNLTSEIHRENIVFVANNLQNSTMANVDLAAALCTTDMSIYPQIDFGKSLFLIDQYDLTYNFAYFKNHTDTATTVENLLNYYPSGPSKIVTVQRILKLIKRELELSNFQGQFYTEYKRLQIAKAIETYLRRLVDYVIYQYDIISVTDYKDINHPGTVIVVSNIEVWPKNCLEKCSIQLDIEVG